MLANLGRLAPEVVQAMWLWWMELTEHALQEVEALLPESGGKSKTGDLVADLTCTTDHSVIDYHTPQQLSPTHQPLMDKSAPKPS